MFQLLPLDFKLLFTGTDSQAKTALPRPRVVEVEPQKIEIFFGSLIPTDGENGICQDTSKKLVRSLFIPEEPQQGLCPYASLPQDIFLT